VSGFFPRRGRRKVRGGLKKEPAWSASQEDSWYGGTRKVKKKRIGEIYLFIARHGTPDGKGGRASGESKRSRKVRKIDGVRVARTGRMNDDNQAGAAKRGRGVLLGLPDRNGGGCKTRARRGREGRRETIIAGGIGAGGISKLPCYQSGEKISLSNWGSRGSASLFISGHQEKGSGEGKMARGADSRGGREKEDDRGGRISAKGVRAFFWKVFAGTNNRTRPCHGGNKRR